MKLTNFLLFLTFFSSCTKGSSNKENLLQKADPTAAVTAEVTATVTPEATVSPEIAVSPTQNTSVATQTPTANPTLPIPPPAPSPLTHDVNKENVVLSWPSVLHADAVLDYVVEVSTNNSDWTTHSDGTSNSPLATLTGLLPDTKYWVRIASVTTHASSVWSEPVEFTTAPLDPLLGSFTEDTALPVNRQQLTSAYHDGYFYIFGGDPGPAVSAGGTGRTYSSQVASDGTLSTWQMSSTTYPNGRQRHTSFLYNDKAYIIGGNNTGGPQSTVYVTTFNTGTVGTWSTTTAMPGGRRRHTSEIFIDDAGNVHFYVIGGSNPGFDTVYDGVLASDGSVSAWTENTPMPVTRYFHGSALRQNDLVVLGGINSNGELLSKVHTSRIDSTGTLGAWSETGSLPTPQAEHATVIKDSIIIVMGGRTAEGLQSKIHFGKVDSQGNVAKWFESAVNLPEPMRMFAATVVGNRLYIFGGNKLDDNGNSIASSKVYVASLRSSGH